MKLITLITIVLLSACTSKLPQKKAVVYKDEAPDINTTKPKLDVTAKQLANEMGSELVSEVRFREGSSVIASADKKKLRELYRKARAQERQIEEVRVVTWADKEYPEDQKKHLPDWQRKLAAKRNDNLEKALKGMDDDLDVKKISMAEQSSGWKELTEPAAAEVKESMEDLEESKTGQASKSIVIFILKKD